MGVFLCQTFARKWVGIAVLEVKASGIRFLIPADFLKGRQEQGIVNILFLPGFIDCPVHKGNVLCRKAAVQRFCKGEDAALPHAVHQDVRAAVQQNGPADFIAPVIVMGKPP